MKPIKTILATLTVSATLAMTTAPSMAATNNL
jgi:hypothetical protein